MDYQADKVSQVKEDQLEREVKMGNLVDQENKGLQDSKDDLAHQERLDQQARKENQVVQALLEVMGCQVRGDLEVQLDQLVREVSQEKQERQDHVAHLDSAGSEAELDLRGLPVYLEDQVYQEEMAHQARMDHEVALGLEVNQDQLENLDPPEKVVHQVQRALQADQVQ